MDYFAGALGHASKRTVVYDESHDEAGNAAGTGRTIEVAANRAPLVGDTRRFAEARCRVACGLTLLSAGIPMFFMGAEVGFQQDYTYNAFIGQREDFLGYRKSQGAGLFHFYQDLIRLRREHDALRSSGIDVLYTHNEHRVIAFRRWDGREDLLVIASLNDRPFDNGYRMSSSRLPDGAWRELFNSDSVLYGGWNTGNGGEDIRSAGGSIEAVVPASGFLVLRKMA
jgi:1,4-alpha-glucan branching enzyme